MIQIVYSRLDTEPEADVLPLGQASDLGVLAREALAGGLLSGQYPPGARFTDPSDTRSGRPVAQIEARLRVADQIKECEVPDGVPMTAWALAWCLASPAVLPGCQALAQLDANAAAADIELTPHPGHR